MAAMRASDAIRDRIQHLQSSFGVSSTFLRIEQARLGEYLTNAHFEEFIRDGRLDPIPWTPKRLRERKPRESDHMQLAKLLHGIACAGCRAHKLVTVSGCMALMRAEFWMAEQDQAVEWLTDGRLWRQLGAPIFLRLAELPRLVPIEEILASGGSFPMPPPYAAESLSQASCTRAVVWRSPGQA